MYRVRVTSTLYVCIGCMYYILLCILTYVYALRWVLWLSAAGLEGLIRLRSRQAYVGRSVRAGSE